MMRADKKLIMAANYSQAKHYARNIMGWKREEWTWVASVDNLAGLHDIVLFDVRAPKYKPTGAEARRYEILRHYIPTVQQSGRVIKINVYNLAT